MNNVGQNIVARVPLIKNKEAYPGIWEQATNPQPRYSVPNPRQHFKKGNSQSIAASTNLTCLCMSQSRCSRHSKSFKASWVREWGTLSSLAQPRISGNWHLWTCHGELVNSQNCHFFFNKLGSFVKVHAGQQRNQQKNAMVFS